MGTNYYLKHPGHSDEITEQFLLPTPKIHIGKNSIGWRFLFRGHYTVKSRKQWIEIINNAVKLGWELKDEYGSGLTPQQFARLVDKYKPLATKDHGIYSDFADDEEWEFVDGEFC